VSFWLMAGAPFGDTTIPYAMVLCRNGATGIPHDPQGWKLATGDAPR
jgi:hypothetical protein